MVDLRGRARLVPWALPAAAVAAVAAGVLVPAAASAPAPTLPPRTAAQLLADVEQAQPRPFTGTVVTTVRLGLPSLPSSDQANGQSSQLFQLLTGTHTARVWFAGPDRMRLAVVDQLTEYDVVRSGDNLWTYDSTQNTVTHRTVPAAADRRREPAPVATPSLTPQQAAQQALARIEPTTAVTVDRTARVAGRPAYLLSLAPKDAGTLVRAVRITIDATTHLPLAVQVWAAHHADPALDVAFTRISFRSPPASVFRFSPPPGAKVTEQQPWTGSERQPGTPGSTDNRAKGTAAPTGRTIGHGWTAVTELPTGTVSLPAGQQSLLRRLTTPVPGGRLLRTWLFSALLTNDGHLYVGAVEPSLLQRVAANGR